MKTSGNYKFRRKLARLASGRIALLLLVSILLFSVSQFAIVVLSNEVTARRHLGELKESLLQLDDMTVSYLLEPSTHEDAVRLFTNPGDSDRLAAGFRRFGLSCPVDNDIIAADAGGHTIYSSFAAEDISSYLDNYNRAICLHASEAPDGSVYRAVYFDIGSYANRMTVLPVRENGELLGFITLFLSGSSWNYYLSGSVVDGVITDLRSNIIYQSRQGVADSMNRFVSPAHGITVKNGQRFWVVSERIEERSAVVYSLVYFPKNTTLYVSLLFLTVMGAVWLFAALLISRTMAQYNAESVEKFTQLLDSIPYADVSYRIHWEDDDEFRQVAEHTNGMLDTIYELNDRNTELIQLNNRIEREQLTAQMNPHFLYNTLEIIRNLAMFDAARAEDIISCLTRVLRYSADTSESEVTLRRDMELINSYLEIQRCRFGSRFECILQIDEECMDCTVPKLLLQPLIENSIKYGFQSRMDLKLIIRGTINGDSLVFTVSDNGGGMPADRAAELQQSLITRDKTSASIGLRNLSRRLYLKYGDNAGIRIQNNEGLGLDVIVTLTVQREDSNV